MPGRMFPLLLSAFGLLYWGAVSAVDGADQFSREVAPILAKHCLECHNERDASGKLVLTDKVALNAGGESGPAVVPRNPGASNLLTRVIAGEMPPPKRGHSQKLSAGEIESLTKWIAAGADWPEGRKLDLYEATSEVRGGRDWWSLQPIKRPGVPLQLEIGSTESERNPIDSFIQSRLHAAQMRSAPAADRATLIKRLYFDLLGLPPTYDEIQDFVGDPAPDACERLVDRLLASPHFGERWGRYWLDAVRYADTCGYERDQEKPYAWKYRDWVINALNQDLPYDQFILHQLAGDELSDRNESTVIATGFLRLGTWNDEPNDADEYKYERLEDLVHVTSTSFLGLTVKCARCHDHKFDPIPQTDYYRMAAAFWPGAIEPRGRELQGGPTKDELGFDVLGWTDIRQPPALHLLRKGEPKQPLGVVEPGHLSFVSSLNRPLESAPLGAKTTHRRRQLAEWIASANNPLTPRVLANRIWMNHFGTGLVRSTDNFGFTGDRPTDPELLEWLAGEILGAGSGARPYQSMKRFHRLLVTSSVYQQSSLHPEQDSYQQRDAGNRLWWHAERRRLESEPLRDRMLLASDGLDTRMTGAGFKPTIQAEALEGLSRKEGAWKPSPVADQRRRAVYMFSQRSLLPPLMTTFDFVDTTLPCVQRPVSTAATQALALLNNEFAHECSSALADRVMRETADAAVPQAELLDQRIRRCWQLALGRDPSETEITAARLHLQMQSERFQQKSALIVADLVLPVEGLALRLAADTGVSVDQEARVSGWRDQSGQGHDASQSIDAQRPRLIRDAMHGLPAIRFDGQRRFLRLAGQVVTSPSFAIFTVVTDESRDATHREIFSNWNGSAGNAGTSLFLGMTGDESVRLSDDFSGVGRIQNRHEPFVLSAVNSSSGAVLHQNGIELIKRGSPLNARNLKGEYVVGQQGNIDGEYWTGDIAELIVYDRELKESERQIVTDHLIRKYHLPSSQGKERDPRRLALASLCHVLLNTNEFVYVD